MASVSKNSTKKVGADENARLLAFLRRRHPEYQDNLPHWKFLEATYKGGRDWFETNIFKYLKEGDEEFAARVQRAYRFNHTREVVNLVGKYIFKSSISRNREDASVEVDEFWKNSTLTGLSIDQYMRLVDIAASTFGRVWVFVDSTKSEDVVTKKDEKEKGARVYTYFVKPTDVLDMGFDEDTGKMRWILIREFKRDDSDPINSTGEVEEQYRLWTETEWKLFRIADKTRDRGAKGVKVSAEGISTAITKNAGVIAGSSGNDKLQVEVVGSGENELGEVPCFAVDNVIGDNKYCAPALIADIAYLDRAIGNYLSNLDAIIQDQTFSQLVMPAQGVLPGDDKYDALREMGTKRIFVFDGEGGSKPEYISPDVKQAELIVDVINKIIHEIYHSLGMAGERTKQDNSVGIDNSSGVAKAYDFERLNSLLTTKSQSLQNCENRLVRLVEIYNGKTVPDVIGQDRNDDDLSVRYPDTFDVHSLFDEFTIAERLALIEAPEGLRREQMKQVVNKLFPTLAKDLKAEIMKNLEEWPPVSVEDLQVVGTMTGGAVNKFPAKGTKKSGGVKAPAAKNASTQKRQGQVTSETP